MKLSKRQLKQIIREEYTRLKRKGLLRESNSAENAFSDLQGVLEYWDAEMEISPASESPIASIQQSYPQLSDLEYLAYGEDNEGAAVYAFWDGNNYHIVADSGYGPTVAICSDAIEAYLCIEMSSYHEPTLHPDALSSIGCNTQEEAYDWHDDKQRELYP